MFCISGSLENHVASIMKRSFKFDELLFNNPISTVQREFPFFSISQAEQFNEAKLA